MRIGVIGGNGVAATNLLCEMIERKMTSAGAFRDAHHPEMIVWQATSAPSRSMFLEGRGPDWRPHYIEIARQFRQLKCDIGCMCCNTAHYALEDVETGSGLPFIDLLKEVALVAQSSGEKQFELFCSDGARKFDLYGKIFRRICPDVKLAYPDETRQNAVTQVICGVKTSARMERDNVPLQQLEVLVAGARHPVIFGCTDLRVAYGSQAELPSAVAIDSLECLADKIVSLAKENSR